MPQIDQGQILPRSGDRLSVAEFFMEFQRLFDSLQNGYYKVECMQSYQEPGNPSYEALMSGDKVLADRLISDHIAKDEGLFTRVMQKGLESMRLRLVEFPLTDYIQWEFKAYQHTARWGQCIAIRDISTESYSSPSRKGSDFISFDDKVILAHDYSQDGLLQGGWLIEDPLSVQKYVDWFRQELSKAVPLAAFERSYIPEA